MKQSTQFRRRDWDIALVFGNLSTEDTSDVVIECGLDAEVNECNSKWAWLREWMERNFYQFEDGTHKDLGFVSSVAAPWRDQDARFLPTTFAQAVFVDGDNAAAANAEAVAEAVEMLETSPGLKHALVMLHGGRDALELLMGDIADLLERFSVAITALKNPDGGTVVPWVLPVSGVFIEGLDEAVAEARAEYAAGETISIEEFADELGDAEAIRDLLAERQAGETISIEELAEELEIDLEE